jgi:hypothetical protein
MKYWEIIADNLKKAGWSWGCVSALDASGRTIWIVDAHRGDGKRFIVTADEKLSAFVELEREVLTVTFYLESLILPSLKTPQSMRTARLPLRPSRRRAQPCAIALDHRAYSR